MAIANSLQNLIRGKKRDLTLDGAACDVYESFMSVRALLRLIGHAGRKGGGKGLEANMTDKPSGLFS